MLRAVTETIRGGLAMGYYVGGMPLASLTVGRAHRRGGRDAAMPLVVRRVRRACAIGGIEWAVTGQEQLPDGPYVLIHNETSLADLLVLHGLVLAEFAESTMGAAVWDIIPGVRRVAEAMGIHLFQRGNREQATRVLDELVALACQGGRVSISGEGRLSPDGQVHHFKRGGALIAIRAGAPLVPVCLVGGHEVLPVGSVRMRPGTIRVIFGEPLSTAGLTDDDAPGLAKRAREVVASTYAGARVPRRRS